MILLQYVCLLLLIGPCIPQFVFPLRRFKEKFRIPVKLNVTTSKAEGVALDGLSLASDPAGQVNFLTMVNNLEGDASKGYYIEMSIGSPAQMLNILVDTGSSNFAVAGAPNPDITNYYNSKLSTTYQSSGIKVSVQYTQGSWVGELGKDIITIPKGPTKPITINIATILQSEDFFLPGVAWQGILGLAYKLLAKPDSSVEPFFDSLISQTGIPNIFSLQMCGAETTSSISTDPLGGSLIMGGIEPTLYTGAVWYTPIKEQWYYQVEVLKLEVGDQNLNLDCREYNTDKAIVDSGTTLLRLPGNVFNAVVDTIIRTSLISQFPAGFWTGDKLACWEKGSMPWDYFPKISIYLRDMNVSQSFRISILPQLYIQVVTEIQPSLICYRFGISPSASGMVIGATVMEGFYVIFDRAQERVGFAVSMCPGNGGTPQSEIAGPFVTSDVSGNCATVPMLREPLLWFISYALMGVCAFILLLLIIVLLVPCQKCRRGSDGVNDKSSLIQNRFK
ncbi:beta-secretase 2 [Polypterus senegalus]